MNKATLFWGVLAFILVVSLLVVKNNLKSGAEKDASVVVTEQAVADAKSLYKKSLVAGTDMSTGPCLTNDLMPGWVVDVVHNPRLPMDDFSHYQCQAYLEGRAKHFVELDTSGNLVRVR